MTAIIYEAAPMSLFPPNASLEDKIQYTIIRLFRLSAIVALGFVIGQGRVGSLLNGILAVILLFIPDIIERRYSVKLPISYSFSIIMLIYGSMVLGGLADFYDRFFWWDELLHSSFGALLGFGGFVILYILSLHKKLKASRFLLTVFAFSVAVTLGVFWEVFEFVCDTLFGTYLQYDSLVNTMHDLITNCLGAGVTVFLGYRFMAHPDGKGLFARAIGRLIEANPRLKNY